MSNTENGHKRILTVDDILAAPDVQENLVEVPEWGGVVKIRSFTKGETQRIRREATLKYNTQTQKKGEIDRERLEMLMLIHGVVEPQFGPEHIEQLRKKAAKPIETILNALLELSGMKEASVDEAEAAFQEDSGA